MKNKRCYAQDETWYSIFIQQNLAVFCECCQETVNESIFGEVLASMVPLRLERGASAPVSSM